MEGERRRDKGLRVMLLSSLSSSPFSRHSSSSPHAMHPSYRLPPCSASLPCLRPSPHLSCSNQPLPCKLLSGLNLLRAAQGVKDGVTSFIPLKVLDLGEVALNAQFKLLPADTSERCKGERKTALSTKSSLEDCHHISNGSFAAQHSLCHVAAAEPTCWSRAAGFSSECSAAKEDWQLLRAFEQLSTITLPSSETADHFDAMDYAVA